VVAPATHDTASAVAAVPFRHPGSVYISAGTWSLVGLEVDAPLISDEAFAANLTNEGGIDNTVRLLKNVNGMWLVHECQRAWAAEGTTFEFDELVRLARSAPAHVSLVDPDDALLACMRYIDSHAQRSGLCADAGEYAWSSCAHHLGHRRDPLIVDHARFWALGNTPFEREGAFRTFLDEGVSAREALAISQATRRGWPIAGAAGQGRLTAQLGRDTAPRPRGRPRRVEPPAT